MNDPFQEASLISRARKECKGYKSVARIAPFAVLVGTITCVSLYLIGASRQTTLLLSSILAFGLALLLFPVFEFLWFLLKAPRLIDRDKSRYYRAELSKSEIELDRAKQKLALLQKAGPERWEQMARSFLEVLPIGIDIECDELLAGTKEWRILADGAETYRSLFEKAGKMLGHLPPIDWNLPGYLFTIGDAWKRWLELLMIDGQFEQLAMKESKPGFARYTLTDPQTRSAELCRKIAARILS